MSKYLNPKADLTFKKVFGEHKNLVMSLLNSLLPLPNDMQITSIEYLSGENHQGNTDKKYSIVDVKCTDNFGRTFVVEMQNYWTTAFFSRTLYNAVLTYSNQLKKGQAFDELKEVYALSLVNESEIPEGELNKNEFIHEYYFTNQKNADDVHKDIALIFVDLQKYKVRGCKAGKLLADLWLKYLTEIDDSTIEVAPELLANSEIAEALEIVERAAYTPEELEAYNKYWLDISTERTALAQSFAEGKAVGFADGKAEGKVEGLAEGKLEGLTIGKTEQAVAMAKKMKADAMPMELIVKYTGLTQSEIESL